MSSIVFILGFNYDSNCYLINDKVLVDTGAGQNKDYLFSKIKENGVDPEDIETLQDLIVIATNDALTKADELTSRTMGQFTKGLSIPGLF